MSISTIKGKKPTFLELKDSEHYKQPLINSLCGGITDVDRFKQIVNYVIDYKSELFNIDEFQGSLYDGEDEVLDLILPSIRRVYGKVFIEPPTILKETRLDLFQEYFDIDEFIDYMIDMLKKTKNCLNEFKNLDRTVDTLTLIVDNYVAGLVEKSRDCEDHTQMIRDLKLNKLGK